MHICIYNLFRALVCIYKLYFGCISAVLIIYRFKWDPIDFGGNDQQGDNTPIASKLNIHLLAYDPIGSPSSFR